jgi:prepilin-type N-terminal cleavage/methylation domain-containing protein
VAERCPAKKKKKEHEMKKSMKKGFTLVELMVVVIIVGILAAVAVPLMSANRDKAIASEAVAAIGSVNTAARLYFVEQGVNATSLNDLINSGHFNRTDLDGTYFNNSTGYGNLVFGDIGTAAAGVNSATVTESRANGKTFTLTWNGTAKRYVIN